jgi:hypothetical protein
MPKTYESLFSRTILFFRNLQLIAINELRHNNLKVYNDEGYGGQEIQLFPAYRFLLEYHNGNYYSAEKNFSNWYFESYVKYFNVPKSKGGMMHGSLDSRVREKILKKIEPTTIIGNRKIIMHEIETLVLNKFNLYKSIKRDGISLIKRDRIRVVDQDKFLILKGGHHRVAICKILGLDYVPVYIEVANVKN